MEQPGAAVMSHVTVGSHSQGRAPRRVETQVLRPPAPILPCCRLLLPLVLTLCRRVHQVQPVAPHVLLTHLWGDHAAGAAHIHPHRPGNGGGRALPGAGWGIPSRTRFDPRFVWFPSVVGLHRPLSPVTLASCCAIMSRSCHLSELPFLGKGKHCPLWKLHQVFGLEPLCPCLARTEHPTVGAVVCAGRAHA